MIMGLYGMFYARRRAPSYLSLVIRERKAVNLIFILDYTVDFIQQSP